MPCIPFQVGEARGFICTRGRRPAPCSVCKARPHERLCDQPLKGKKAGATCSARLCMRCVYAVRPGLDLCPAHAKARREWLVNMRAELGAFDELP